MLTPRPRATMAHIVVARDVSISNLRTWNEDAVDCRARHVRW